MKKNKPFSNAASEGKGREFTSTAGFGKKSNERLEALRLLIKVVETKTPLSHLMQPAHLSPLTKELCFGVCRHYYRLQALADSLVDKRPKAPEVWLVLLIGLYQLHFMQKPDYAVVKETVDLLDALKKNWAKGLANAVLRRFCREKAQILASLQTNQDFLYGHPDWFIRRIQKDWPQNWQVILKANDEHPPMSLRVNQRQFSCQQYLTCLQQAGIDAHAQCYSPVGFTLDVPCNVHDLPGFASGAVSVQDESAQLAVSLLDLQPGLRVLDACCAPGGKTCHILEAQPELAACIAVDLDEKRLERVADNLVRLNLQATLLQGDGLKPETWWDGQLFDRILLDAPCSATGVIRRHPDIRLLRLEDEISAVARLQNQLLHQLWPLLALNGLLVYATCSIMKEENERQIAAFIVDQPDCEVVCAGLPCGRAVDYGWQILPGDFNGDGFFYSLLRKK
ncbi:16S rRNA (cytosine(967)-C(5))-methyltransferase RsmB [Legionella fairfieldensis]|uniref:16S rRNA (cytosine(967)-C(5))-methyltransferase RsmB n=1 Tax=Legionella fairfieldensis TaxID=45064 RepID=UPI0005649A85|nr:16S rRNA (cytosine(967)-C(5))-methyltransferase RsmB [Legionella fairfieldensis]